MSHDVVLSFLKEEAQMKAELWTDLYYLYLNKEELNHEIEEILMELDDAS